MNPNDIRRGDSQGYRGDVTRPASSNAERFGRDQGAARRQAEIDAGKQGSSGAGIPVRYALIALVMGGVILASVRTFAESLQAMGVLAASVVGLALTPFAARIVRVATPVYVGTLVGLGFGAFTLMMRGTPLTTENIFIYPMLGAVFGVLVILFRPKKLRQG